MIDGLESSKMPVPTEQVEAKPVTKTDISVSGKPVAKRSKFLKAVADFILPEDCCSFGAYLEKQTNKILKNVVFPKMCDIIMDSVSTILTGEARATRTTSTSSIPRVSYQTGYVTDYTRPKNKVQEAPVNRRVFYEDLKYEDIKDAESLRLLVQDAFYSQNYVTVLQFYSFANYGEHTTPEQDNYGWRDISSMKVERTYDGLYTLKMPNPVYLGR